MKFVHSIMIVFAAILCNGTVLAQTTPQPPLITVFGTAEVKVAPDEAVFELAVETTDKDLQKSKLLNDHLLKKLLDAIKPFVTDQRLIQTGYISVNPEYQLVQGKERLFLGYEIKREVSVTLRDVSRFDELLSEVIKAGVTVVDDVHLRTTQLRQYKDKARAMAVKAAQEKAAAMATEIGQSIGKAVVITEQSEGGWYAIPQSRSSNALSNASVTSGGSSEGSDSLFAAGLITVKASVTVSFELK